MIKIFKQNLISFLIFLEIIKYNFSLLRILLEILFKFMTREQLFFEFIKFLCFDSLVVKRFYYIFYSTFYFVQFLPYDWNAFHNVISLICFHHFSLIKLKEFLLTRGLYQSQFSSIICLYLTPILLILVILLRRIKVNYSLDIIELWLL